MCLTGCSGVGKSVFYHNYFGTLDKFKDVTTSPNGDNNCKKIEIEGKGRATVSIWDTAGQEKYASITNIFYQNCQAVFIIYDVTNQESFDQVQTHWVKQLEKQINLKEISMCLVANKIDLTDKRVISTQQGEDLARKLGCLYRETSAIKNQGVNEAVVDLTEQVITKSS